MRRTSNSCLSRSLFFTVEFWQEGDDCGKLRVLSHLQAAFRLDFSILMGDFAAALEDLVNQIKTPSQYIRGIDLDPEDKWLCSDRASLLILRGNQERLTAKILGVKQVIEALAELSISLSGEEQ